MSRLREVLPGREQRQLNNSHGFHSVLPSLNAAWHRPRSLRGWLLTLNKSHRKLYKKEPIAFLSSGVLETNWFQPYQSNPSALVLLRGKISVAVGCLSYRASLLDGRAAALLPKLYIHSVFASALKEPADSSLLVFLLTRCLAPGARSYFVRSKGVN